MKALLLIALLLVSADAGAQYMIVEDAPIMTLIRPSTDDSITVCSLPAYTAIKRIVVVVDTLIAGCDSISIGISGYSTQRPGNLMQISTSEVFDGAYFGIDGANNGPGLSPLGTWYMSDQPQTVTCYLLLAEGSVGGQMRVFVYLQHFY